LSDLREPYRPGYHFTPHRHWMNDPNGLVYSEGRYHLYFQHNPEANDWASMSWGHASSEDLVHWTEHPVAIPHSPTEQIFSGCVVVDHGNSSGFGRAGGPPPLVAVYTSAYSHGLQAQSLAYSTDAGMAWAMYAGNPVLDRSSTAFRDPKVIWYPTGDEAGYWVMVAVEAEACQVLVYRSDDLKNWSLLSTFGPAGSPAGCWECPDLFALAVDGDPSRTLWVLVVSVNPGGVAGGSGARYFIGDFDGTTFASSRDDGAVLDELQWLDWGRDFYAAVSFGNAPDGRRLMLGWMSNWDYAHEVPTSPWRGTMSLARELSLCTVDGAITLVQRPVAELESLAVADPQVSEPFDLEGQRTQSGSSHYRLDVTFEQIDASEFGLDLFVGPGQATRLRYAPESGRLSLDRRASGETAFSTTFPSIDVAPVALQDRRLQLQIYVDRASVEVFAQGGSVCLTQQVFATEDSTWFRLLSCGGRTRVSQLVYRPLEPV
jgi:fructan beta-fructosidase